MNAVEVIREMTEGRGADVCVDAVGMEADRNFLEKMKAAFNMEMGTVKVLEHCMSAVRRGGRVTVVGVYGVPYDNFPISQFFDKGLMMRGGQVPVHKYIDQLLYLVETGKVVLEDVISHKVPLERAADMYSIFNNKEDNCVKVVLKPGT